MLSIYEAFFQQHPFVERLKVLDWDEHAGAECIQATNFDDMKVFFISFHKGEYDLKAPLVDSETDLYQQIPDTPQPEKDTTPIPQAKVMNLPNESLQQHWEKYDSCREKAVYPG